MDKGAIKIKAGACAILDNSVGLCRPFIPLSVKRDEAEITIDLNQIASPFYQKLTGYKTAGSLQTVDFPVFGFNKDKELLNRGVSFIDMETFYFADFFKGNNFFPLLAGTDAGDAKAFSDFKKNLPRASEELKNAIMQIIS